MRKRILWAVGILLLATLIFGGTITALIAEETPAVSIEYFTLSHDNTVYIKYAVDCRNYEVTRENTGMLYWTAEPENAIIGTEESRSTILGYELIEGQKYYIFKYDRLSAAQMCDDIWARAYVTVDDKTYYSDVEKYSVETYAAHKLGLVEGSDATSDETLKELLYAMLEYGEKAQKHFPEARKDIFPTDILHPFTVTFDADNGTDTITQTVYRNRKVTKPEAPVKDGCTFVGWFNGDTEWNFETNTVTEDVTLTAKWKTIYSEGLRFISKGDGTCYVSGIGTCTDTIIIIPPVSQDGDRVISIGDRAFYCCRSVTSITIPDGVTSIGSSAFYDCSLRGITIPSSVTSIGSSAFYGCGYMTRITIPDSVTSIGSFAFYNCQSMTRITIPDGVTSIGPSTFYNCWRMTDVTIGNGVKSIGENAFRDCSALKRITIGNGVTSVGYCAFSNCSRLMDVYITDLAKWCGISFGDFTATPMHYAHQLYLKGTLIAESPILVTPSGIVTLVTLLHLENTPFAMLVTPSGIVILVRLLHPENAESPILVTPSGIVTLVTLLQFSNAYSPILVTLSGISNSEISVPFRYN